MRIIKCDICKKTIASDAESLLLAYKNIETFDSFELCSACSKPIVKILKEKKLIQNDKKKGN